MLLRSELEQNSWIGSEGAHVMLENISGTVCKDAGVAERMIALLPCLLMRAWLLCDAPNLRFTDLHNIDHFPLTHYGLLIPYGDIDPGQHRLIHSVIASSYFLNQCWLINSVASWHSPEGDFTRMFPDIYHGYDFGPTLPI